MNNRTENNNRQIRVIKLLTILLSLSLLLASLTQNCYYIGENNDTLGSFGLIAFLVGWVDIFGSAISWLANPFLIISWKVLVSDKFKKAFIYSSFAFLLSLSFMLVKVIPLNEGGGYGEITAYDIGYFLWLTSCGVNFIGNLTLYYLNLKK